MDNEIIEEGDVVAAERLGKLRMTALTVFVLMFIGQQLRIFLPFLKGAEPDAVALIGCALLDALALYALIARGSRQYSEAINAMLFDETTEANRTAALRLGFASAILAAAGLLALQAWIAVPAPVALQAVAGAGLIVALVRWRWLDWRANA